MSEAMDDKTAPPHQLSVVNGARPATFGILLARLRQDRGWSQSGLARRCGVGQPYLSRLESGYWTPGADVLRSLAEGLELPPETAMRLVTVGVLGTDPWGGSEEQ